jgi:hypothetical protein
LKKILASLAVMAALVMPANALDPAVYADVGHWTVYGSTDDKTCIMIGLYENGHGLSIRLDQNLNTTLNIHDTKMKEGQVIDTRIDNDKKQLKMYKGYGLVEGVISIEVDELLLNELANAKGIYISVVDSSFMLNDSKAAMLKTLECVEVMVNSQAI